jgi:hypothetical protein
MRLHSWIRGTVACAGTVLSAACNDQAPTAPTTPTRSVSFAISDGGRTGGTAHFFFLPPTVIPQPLLPPTFSGVFDPSWSTVVRVCEGDAACDATNAIAAFSPAAGTGGTLLARIRVNPVLQSYSAVWDTRRCAVGPCALNPATPYRVHVAALTTSGAEVQIGFADLQVFARGTTPAPDLANYSPIVAGLPYVIAFRLEEGLSLGATVQGRVTQLGAAAAGMKMTLSGTSYSASVVTDAVGFYVFTAVPPGTYALAPDCGGVVAKLVITDASVISQDFTLNKCKAPK